MSSLRKAGLPKQALSSRSVFTPFFQGSNQRRISGSVSVPSLCACSVDPVLSERVKLEPARGLPPRGARALALGRDPLVMSRTGKRRMIGIGWRAVNPGDRLHNGVASSTVG